MKLFALLPAALAAFTIASAPVQAKPPSMRAPLAAGPVQLVASDCFAIGESEAQRRGARLVRAEQVGNRCELVLLVQGGPGERPRREVVTVPLR